jgi:plastocyanin
MHEPVARPRTRSLAAGSVAIAAMLLIGGGSAVAADQSVAIADFLFTPSTVTVTVGDTVTWTNSGAIVHTATATGGSWDTGDIAPGASAAITFSTAGTFAYICTPHPTMTGTVVVQAPTGGGGGSGGTPTTPVTDTAPAVAAGSSDTGSQAPVLIAVGGLVLLAIAALRPRRRPGS